MIMHKKGGRKMSKKIIVINGLSGCGKSSFIDFCGKFCSVKELSVADQAKRALTLLGWDGEKTPKNRNLLEYLVTLSKVNFNGVFWYLKEEIEKTTNVDIIFINSRDPDDISKFVKRFRAITLLIVRENYTPQTLTYTDKLVYKYLNYDHIISSSDLANLKENARIFVGKILGE